VAENIITQKVGPLPLVVWVIGGSGAFLLFIMLTHKGSSGGQANATNQVSALAPTEAEAFGTIEQQQQDVTNALTTLGQNQSALGGSLSTLSGTIDTNQNWNAAQFANLLSGMGQVQQGQTAASNQATSYYQSLLNNLSAYSSQIYNQQSADYLSLYNQGQGNTAQLTGIMTDPWIRQFYENLNLQGLTPYQQSQFWTLLNQQNQTNQPQGSQPGQRNSITLPGVLFPWMTGPTNTAPPVDPQGAMQT
jgi:hypothetical protein